MRDEMDARIWNEHGAHFSESLEKLFKTAAASFRRLHQIEWDAPWLRERRHGAAE